MKIRLAYRILTVLFMSFSSCFLSTTGEVQAGSIEGYVFFDSSSTPVPIGDLTVGAYLEDDDKNLIKYAQTDAVTGQYTFDDLSEDTYKFVIFTNNKNYIREWYHSGLLVDAYSFADAEPVSVGSDPVSLDDTFLKKGAQITGTVTAEGSNGATKIAGIIVRVFDTDGNWITTAQATGIDGIYSLSGLNTGNYKIQFRAGDTGYASEWDKDRYRLDTADIVKISSLTDEKIRDIELGTSTSISGTVKNSEGTAIEGALVKVYVFKSDEDFVDSPLEFATTGSDGTFTVTGLPDDLPDDDNFKVRFFQREGNGSGAGLTEWYDDKVDFASASTVSAGATVNAVLESRFNWLIFTQAIIRRP